ncbi:MAG: peptide deformylase [Chloroflexi bacterium RBG_13_52_14]|nr:MAG: peptide deformylase [Chloroflexi bacterium RBG_13_52_14]
MAVLPLRFAPDPVLRQKAKRVSSIDTSIERLIDNMLETLPAVSGLGLAAPQVGVPLRVAVIQMPEEEEGGEIVLINPVIVKKSGERLVDEGCLSIPGYRGEIKRSVSITIKGRNRQGKEFRLKATELLAQALEHEIDHLNGILYIDHLESPDKLSRIELEDEDGGL